MSRETLLDLGARQLAVLGRERIDRRCDEALLDRQFLGIFRQAEDREVVLVRELTQILPPGGIGCGKIDVALPQPWRLLLPYIAHQRQRLRIVDDYSVAVLQMQSGG